MEIIDRKFRTLAVNPVNGNIYTEKDSILFCAKDAALPATLNAYQEECIRLGANPEHITSVGLLIDRVCQYQKEIEVKIPDTVGRELTRCLHGIL